MTKAPAPGAHMKTEMAEAIGAFCRAAGQKVNLAADHSFRAIYTVARGSSDATANILSYELMRETGKPVTSLPPSVFSLGQGVDLADSLVLLVSQSGASEDLVRSAKGAKRNGAGVAVIVNAENSPVEQEADVKLAICAGPERAVPATKSVIGSIGAGLALISTLSKDYGARRDASTRSFAALEGRSLPNAPEIVSALLRAHHVYVIGRDTGFGAAQELALKLKECCAMHAEPYSASEVLHGPLQLVTNPLLILILDTGQPAVQESLDIAQARFRQAGGSVIRIRTSDAIADPFTPAAAAAALLYLTYPIVHAAALALGHDPDRPSTLSKVTQTT